LRESNPKEADSNTRPKGTNYICYKKRRKKTSSLYLAKRSLIWLLSPCSLALLGTPTAPPHSFLSTAAHCASFSYLFQIPFAILLSVSLGVLFLLLQNSGFLFCSSLALILASNKCSNLSLSLSVMLEIYFSAESTQKGELEREREEKGNLKFPYGTGLQQV
jgi:hypothetical protein